MGSVPSSRFSFPRVPSTCFGSTPPNSAWHTRATRDPVSFVRRQYRMSSGTRGGPVRLRLPQGRTLICEVSDGSPAMPRIRHASETDEGGRGLQRVAALSHRWGARCTATGKCIWTEQGYP